MKIDLDLSEETLQAYSDDDDDDDDESSLPEIVFKRIVVPPSEFLEDESM